GEKGEQQPKGEQGKDTKPSAPKAPEKAPTPKAPEKSTQSKAPASKSAPAAQKSTLPATGETNHPFFTLAALSVIASAGLLTLKRKKS
ncbi:TPA: LPXTG cell wall anchor domain-containing protein, partial [Streptococcus equi subsp. zooepidemicus]|nr:LPXTG cell wall anchor domain-containing protein [Streptococcus equi subsp. zooepidemicus]HEL1125888.1 LPXTG cell wall anchor domain-containing protein [Streptococcus equi subsp. zooepidemicus]